MRNPSMQALVLSSDTSVINHFNDAFKELGIQFRSSADSREGCAAFQCARYEAIVLDLETIDTPLPVLKQLKNTRANERAVIFAIASNSSHRDAALRNGAHFVIDRPIQRSEIQATLTTAYDLMYAEKRQYFRCAVNLPVTVKRERSGSEFSCRTINLSSNGVAFETPVSLDLAETVQMAIVLPDGFVIHATGIVIWDDKHSKCGLRLQCNEPRMREHLNSWLDAQFSGREP